MKWKTNLVLFLLIHLYAFAVSANDAEFFNQAKMKMDKIEQLRGQNSSPDLIARCAQFSAVSSLLHVMNIDIVSNKLSLENDTENPTVAAANGLIAGATGIYGAEGVESILLLSSNSLALNAPVFSEFTRQMCLGGAELKSDVPTALQKLQNCNQYSEEQNLLRLCEINYLY